jgi:AcrR family transcriptional regulator
MFTVRRSVFHPEHRSQPTSSDESLVEALTTDLSKLIRTSVLLFCLVKGSQTKAKITDSALAYASERGLSAITIGGLAERVGRSKGGLCAHYPSKESLQIGVLRAAQDLAQQAVFDNPAPQSSELGHLVEFFDRWTGWATRSGLPGGCPFVAAVFEFDDLEGPIRDELMAIQGDFFLRISALVQAVVDSGEFDPSTDVSQVVWEIVAIYNGHHVAQRFLRDPTADQRATTAFDGVMKRHLTASTRSQSRPKHTKAIKKP